MRARGGKLTLAQIDRWYRDHFAAYDGEPWDSSPTFVTCRRTVLDAIDELQRWADALRAPFEQGAAEMIATFDDQAVLEELTEWACTIQGMGRALRWGLAGAPASELERMRKEREESKEKTAARAAELSAPDRRALVAQRMAESVMPTFAEYADVLSPTEKREIVEQLSNALGLTAAPSNGVLHHD